MLPLDEQRALLGGLDEQFPVGVDEQDPVVLPLDEQYPDRSSRLGLDEQDPVEG